MNSTDLRTRANLREASRLAGAARRLERNARGTRLETAAAATQALLRDATLTSLSEDELRRRATEEDGDAIAELCRRSGLALAA